MNRTALPFEKGVESQTSRDSALAERK